MLVGLRGWDSNCVGEAMVEVGRGITEAVGSAKVMH